MADLGRMTGYPVYLGVWTNWSHGQILGLTLTLTRRNGAFLTAFLALYVTFTGTCFWRIGRFALHQYLSSDAAEDTLYHQRQSILRNSASGTNGLISLSRVMISCRSKTRRALYRILPLIIMTLLFTTLFAVASIFSARIGSEMDDEVLITGRSCGQLISEGVIDGDTRSNVIAPYESKDTNTLANYVQRCYSNISDTDSCGPYVKGYLPRTVDRNATCPFKENICLYKDRNIKLDTGHIDTHHDMGMNAPPHLRMTVRHITHCAPLVTNGYKRPYNYSKDITYMRYYYGKVNPKLNDLNFTYQYPELSIPQKLFERNDAAMVDYTVGYVYF